MTQYAIAASILLSRLIATDAARGTANHPFAIPPRNLAVSPRVVNGDDVGSHTNHPYMVSLQEGEVGGYGSHYCGASLIAPDIILTAAHCGPIPGNDKVQIGRYDLSNSTESTFEEFAVFDVFYHPGWGTKGLDNDFAIVQIDGRSNMDPVAIDDGSVELASGTDLRVIGWGLTETGFIADVLQEGVVDYVANTDCNAIWQYQAGAEVTDNMMCAMRSGEEFVVDVCNGDSGGPLMTTDGNAVQVGVVSWGVPFPCESYILPGVYARISAAYDWILEVTCKNSKYGHPDCAPTTSPSPTTSPAPTSLCNDVPGWVDSYGDGCSWYEQEIDDFYYDTDDSFHLCLYFGATSTSGISVYEACCVCGGGMNLDLDQPTDAPSVSMQPTTTQSPSVSPTVSAKPTSSSAPTETCVDAPDWIDVYGDDCSFYSEEIVDDLFSYYYDDGMTKCDLWGDIPDAETELVTANMACCECGGGAHTIPTPSPTLSLEPTKSMAPTSLCYDIPDWVAEEIFTCDLFHVEFADATATTLCEFFGEVEDNNGVNAIEACCACGGGMMRDLDAPSNSPTATFAPTLSTKPSAAPTVSAAPSLSAAPTEECFDKEDWVDSYGDDCSWYAEDDNFDDDNFDDDFWMNRQRQRKLEQELYDDDYFYENPSRCELFGDSTDFNGDISANMACCVCGGGKDKGLFPTAAPTISNAPTTSSAPTSVCVDKPNWVDTFYGATCAVFEDGYFDEYDDDYVSDSDFDACEFFDWLMDVEMDTPQVACCACGGGFERDPNAPSSSPTVSAAPSISAAPTGECFDKEDWVDYFGDDCSWYAEDDYFDDASGGDDFWMNRQRQRKLEQELYDDDYESSSRCELFGDSTSPNGISANQACCVCGGGKDKGLFPTAAPTVSSAPTTSSAPTSVCADKPNWVDTFYGATCAVFEDGYFDEYDDDYVSDSDFDACEFFDWLYDEDYDSPQVACCACGGGFERDPNAPSSSPTVSEEPTVSQVPSAAPTFCEDYPNWMDVENGYECYIFDLMDDDSGFLCEWYADVVSIDGVTLMEACCACGGGMIVDEDAPSSSPSLSFTPSVSQSPTAAPTVSAAPSVSAAPTEECFDKEDWVDYFGDDCSWYAEDASGEDDFWINRQRQRKLEQELYDDDYFYESLSRCEEHGDTTDFNGDISANMACCVCGGGAHAVPTPPPTVSMSPTLSPAPTTECQDHEWSANMGSWDMHCVDLSEDSEGEIGVSLCDIYGYLADSGGTDVLARDACCVCGGGQDRQIDPPEAASSSPIATPSANPTVTPTANPTANPTVTPSVTPSVTPNSSPNTPSTSAPATPSSNVSSSASMFGTNGFSLLFTCSVTWFVYYLFSGV